MSSLSHSKALRDHYLLTLLVTGIMIMLAFITSRHFLRVDLTQDQEFAISNASIETVRALDDIVTVKVYFSGELPPNLLFMRQYVEDILGELASYAHGNLNVIFMDPSKPDVAKEAESLGIPPVRMNIMQKDKFEVKNGYLGIALQYGGKTQAIPVVQNLETIEYDLLSAINKLTEARVPKVGFLTGHDEYEIDRLGSGTRDDAYATARETLEKNATVVPVKLTGPASLDGIDTLVIGGPRTEFSDAEKYDIDQYLVKGGNVILFLPAVDVAQGLTAKTIDLKLTDLLEWFGVRVEPALVLDQSNVTASFAQGYFSFVVPYPFWVKATEKSMNKAHSILTGVSNLVLPWVSPLTLSPPAGVKATTLVSSSAKSWTQKEPFNLDPNGQVEATASPSPQVMAALLEGPFKSYYADRDKPVTDDKGYADKTGKTSRLLVVGDARVLADSVVGQYPQNMTFFLNAVDYMTLGEKLSGIRPKVFADRPLTELSDSSRQLVKLAGTFGMPALVILYGVVYSVRRKRKKLVL